MTNSMAIEAVALTKSYGSSRVLNGVDLAVPPGRVLALLGLKLRRPKKNIWEEIVRRLLTPRGRSMDRGRARHSERCSRSARPQGAER